MAKESFSKRAKRLADECREIMLSDTMTVSPCDGCDCGSVFLKLHRSDGGVFVIAPMSADVADNLAFDLSLAANKARAAAGRPTRSN